MALLLIDLDNTLINRDLAFSRAVSHLLTDYALPPPRTRMGDGSRPRREERRTSSRNRSMTWRSGKPPRTDGRRSSSRTAILANNGPNSDEPALDEIIAGLVISGELGCRKPDRKIFDAAAATVGLRLDSHTRVIGDTPKADIGGANEIGAQSVWPSSNRVWPTKLPYGPTYTAPTLPAAIEIVLAHADRAMQTRG